MIKELEKIKFPQYRMYLNGKSYFKIISLSEFDEVQLIGSKKIITSHIVKILPDRNFIMDLLIDYSLFAEEITEKRYFDILL